MHDVGADTISLTGHIIGNFMFLFIKPYIISKSDDFRFLPQGAGYDKHWGGASQGCVHGGVEGRRGGWRERFKYLLLQTHHSKSKKVLK